jgi:RNA-directed DNA polymerase
MRPASWCRPASAIEENLRGLNRRLHQGAYRARPSRRGYIPKADGRQRPLGIASLEDKIVQRAVVEVLNAIDHGWLVKFIEHREGDRRVLRLIQKWLSAGVMEHGKWTDTEVGSPQGATVSPLLANVFLHYVLDLWVQQWRNRTAHGDLIVVRYCDDFIVGFQHRSDAERFLKELRERFARFRLELHPDKTRLIAFGRYALLDRQRRGQAGSPETFQFSRLHAHRCAVAKGRTLAPAAYDATADDGLVARGLGRSATPSPSSHPGPGALAGGRPAWALRLLRRADQQRCA